MLAVMSSAAAHERSSDHPDLSSDTLRKLERASGGMAAASITAMERQLPWFRRLSADQRSGVLLVTQNGVAGFVAWLRDPQQAIRLTAEAFRGAPRDLARWVSLRQTVELVRIAIEVFEQQLPTLAADDAERAVLTEAVLRYGREIAFAAATSYAAAAEARGAWDARLEALVVDGIVRGDAEESLLSRAAALGWDPAAEATVLVGNPTSEDPPEVVYEVRSRAARAGRPVLIGVQGSRLVVVLAGPVDGPAGHEVLTRMATAFGSGPVVAGPTMSSLAEAHRSAQDALSGLRAVVAWPAAPPPGPLHRPAAGAGAGRRPRGRAPARGRGRAPAGGRGRLAAGDRGRLPGGGRGAGELRPAALRPPQHRALPAAQGHRADRPQRVGPPGRPGPAGRPRGRPPRPLPRPLVIHRPLPDVMAGG
nr:hypothetical protein GCM10020241_20740 [Streptoalloteichus tenebrarius]